MPKGVKSRAKKAGLPAGTLVHIGEVKGTPPKITLFQYTISDYQEQIITHVSHCTSLVHPSKVTWINVDGVGDIDLISQLGQCFGIHPLVLEDIVNTDQRPKIEDYDHLIYVVLPMLFYDKHKNKIDSEQVSLILKDHLVISFQEEIKGDVFDPVRAQIKNGLAHLRQKKSDYLLYALIDLIVDNYFTILEKISDRIEHLEDELINNPTPRTLKKIYHLKREMLFLRKSIWPLRETLNILERGDTKLIEEATQKYFNDVEGHVIQIMDVVETYREMLSGMLDMYLSSVGNKTNIVMKVLTIITVIFMPLTFITGFYGMNLKYLPGLDSHSAFISIVASMLGIVIGMIIYFRKKKWI